MPRRSDILDLVARLADRSLLEVDASGTLHARYHLLENIRVYARERADQAGEGLIERDRHARYFASMAEQASLGLRGAGGGGGSEQAMWYARLDDEHDNVVAALSWCRSDQARAAVGLRIVSSLWPYWNARGRQSHVRGVILDLLNHYDDASDRGTPVLAGAFHGYAMLSSGVGDYPAAVLAFERALAMLRAAGDQAGEARTLSGLANVCRLRGDPEGAMERGREALQTFRGINDRAGVALSLSTLGNIALESGDYEQASEHHAQALAARRALGDRTAMSWSLNNLAVTAYLRQRYPEAERHYQEALAIQTELKNDWARATTLMNIGLVANRLGETARCADLLRQSVELRRRNQDLYGLAESLVNLAPAVAAIGDPAGAWKAIRECLSIVRRTGAKRVQAFALEEAAGLFQSQGDGARAAELFGAAGALRTAIRCPKSPVDQAEHDRRLESLRLALGGESFSSSFAKGSAISADEAARSVSDS